MAALKGTVNGSAISALPSIARLFARNEPVDEQSRNNVEKIFSVE